MISHTHRCIFIRIPKTASRAVMEQFKDAEFMTHTPLRDLRHFDFYPEYFKFAFVRNPWDRLVSTFHYLKGGGHLNGGDLKRKAAYVDSVDGDFSRFVTEIIRGRAFERTNQPVGPNGLMVHLIPQVEWIFDADGRTDLQFVGRYERLEEHWGEVRTRLGMDTAEPLRRVNPSVHRDYRSLYTQRTIEIVRDAYRDDIDAFEYEFDMGTGE